MRLFTLTYTVCDAPQIKLFAQISDALVFIVDKNLADYDLTMRYPPFELTEEGIEWLNKLLEKSL